MHVSWKCPRIRLRSAVLASLAIAMVGGTPAAYAAPVPTQHPNSTSSALNSAIPAPSSQFQVGRTAFPSSGTAAALPQPVVLSPNIERVTLSGPFQDLLPSAWAQANNLGQVVADSNNTNVRDSAGNPVGVELCGLAGHRCGQGALPAVPTPSIAIQVPVGFADISSSPIYPQPAVPHGFRMDVGGDHGIYSAEVDDCLALTASGYPGLSQVLDQQGNSAPCTDALGNPGTWWVLGSAQTNIYSSTSPKGQGLSPSIIGSGCFDAQAAQDMTAVSCVQVPIQLPVIANALQLTLKVHMVQDSGDTFNCPFFNCGTAPAGEITVGSTQTDLIHAEASSTLALQPVIVLPAALAQLKVMPYTIVYNPPGNASQSTFSTTTTFGTQMTAGDTTSIDNTTKKTSTGDVSATVSASFGLAGADFSTDSHWDHSTSADVGQIQTDFTSIGASVQKVLEFSLSTTTLVPGSKGAYRCSPLPCAEQPFWSDEMVLLQHPQLGIWNVNGSAQVQVLGARGSAMNPDFANPSIRDLDDCATSQGLWPHGYKLPDGDVLSAQECLSLAMLDPFYLGNGQSASCPTSRPGFPQSCLPGRGSYAGGTDYGMDPAGTGQDENQKIGQVVSWNKTTTQARTSTFDAQVTDVFGNSYSAGLTLGAKASVAGINVGFTTDVTVQSGHSTTNTVGMKISFQNSTAATVQSATAITGQFDDHNTGLGYRPHVDVYQDLLFGGYMFLDPAACGRAGCLPPGGFHVKGSDNGSSMAAVGGAVVGGTVSVKSATVKPPANPPSVPTQHVNAPAGTGLTQAGKP